jgi:hypothetical protein
MDRNLYATTVYVMPDGTEVPKTQWDDYATLNAVQDDRQTLPTKDKQPKPWEKLVNYFPAEGVALYAALAPLFASEFDGPKQVDTLTTWLWVIFGISIVLQIVTLRLIWKVKRAWQIVLSLVAFAVYMAGLGGPFVRMEDYNPFWPGVLAILLSAFLAVLPVPTRPEDQGGNDDPPAPQPEPQPEPEPEPQPEP